MVRFDVFAGAAYEARQPNEFAVSNGVSNCSLGVIGFRVILSPCLADFFSEGLSFWANCSLSVARLHVRICEAVKFHSLFVTILADV
jgi:hypothetical protein